LMIFYEVLESNEHFPNSFLKILLFKKKLVSWIFFNVPKIYFNLFRTYFIFVMPETRTNQKC